VHSTDELPLEGINIDGGNTAAPGSRGAFAIPESEARDSMDDVLSVREVALYLRLNVQTVYRLAREGKLPARKIGRQWRFSRREVEALVHDRPIDELVVEED
jgi:excisionase family DNA binding protein